VIKEGYQNAQQIWNTLKIKILVEFNSTYNKIDIFFLAEIMENFRNNSLKRVN